MNSSQKKWLIFALKGLFSAALLLLIFNNIDPLALYNQINFHSLDAYLLAGALFFATWALNSYKWKIFLPEIPYRTLFELNLLGNFYAMALPAQVAGDAVKAVILSRGRSDTEKIAASVIVDKVTGLTALLLTGVGGAFLSNFDTAKLLLPYIALAALITLIILYLLHITAVRDRILALIRNTGLTFKLLQPLTGLLERIVHAWLGYLKSPRTLVAGIVIGIGVQLLAVMILMTLARTLSIELLFYDWCWIFSAVGIVVLLPVTISGIGLREGAFVGLLTSIGIEKEAALALSLSYFVIIFLGGLSGVVFTFKNHK